MSVEAKFFGFGGAHKQYCLFVTDAGLLYCLTRAEAGVSGPKPRMLQGGQDVVLSYRSDPGRGYYYVDWEHMCGDVQVEEEML